MGVVRVQRLRLEDGITLEQTMPLDAPPNFEATAFGVLHHTDSVTGKRFGDEALYPWHAVAELRTWRRNVRL